MLTPVLPVSVDAHMLLGCGLFGFIPDAVCNFFNGAGQWLSSSLELVQNPFKWLYHHTLGAPIPQHSGDPGWDACQSDWSQPACPKIIDQLKPANLTLASAWPRLYGSLSTSGVVIAATCCVVRVVRGVFDERLSGVHVLVDNVVRMVVAVGVLVVPTPGNSLLLTALVVSTTASGRIATAAAGAVASAFTSTVDLTAVVGRIAADGFGVGGIGDFLVAIPILLVAVAFVYLMSLYLLRIIQLVFAVATAPLFVALAVYDPRNRFLHWWLDLFTSAMVLPVVLAICGSLTAGIAVFFLDGGPGTTLSPGGGPEAVVRTLLACFAVLGGIWMTGKAVHGLAWRGFSHGGITGAATAVSTTVMAVPNAAGDGAALLRAAGREPRQGGLLETLSRPALRRGGAPTASPRPSDTGVAIAAAAAGRAAEMAGESHEVDAGIAAAASADFTSHGSAGAILDAPPMQAAFNRAIGAAVGRFAAGTEGRQVVASATRHLDATNPAPAARVSEYVRMLAADPQLGEAVSGAALASLLHNQPPDLVPVLRTREALAA